MATIYTKVFNHYEFKYQTVFSARFGGGEMLFEVQLFINLKINPKWTEIDIKINVIKTPLEHQNQKQEMKDSGWRFSKINSVRI